MIPSVYRYMQSYARLKSAFPKLRLFSGYAIFAFSHYVFTGARGFI